MVPVLIVGAGPTGLAMAGELARYGVKCRIVDKAPHASTTSKALAVQARTIEQFEPLGIADRAVEAGRKIHGVRIHSKGNEIAAIDLSRIPSRYPFVLVLP